MSSLMLSDREQAAVRALLAADQLPGHGTPGACAVVPMSRLISCDAIGMAVLDAHGAATSQPVGRRASAYAGVPQAVRPLLGVHQRDREGDGGRGSADRALAVLSLGVRNGPAHVVTLWMVRRTSSFSVRDRDLLLLVAPALERLMSQRILSPSAPALTVQESRVLRQVASGLSNAEIADLLHVAPCTVRKHLENAYRKLGVTNRLAAVLAVEGSAAPGSAVASGASGIPVPVGG